MKFYRNNDTQKTQRPLLYSQMFRWKHHKYQEICTTRMESFGKVHHNYIGSILRRCPATILRSAQLCWKVTLDRRNEIGMRHSGTNELSESDGSSRSRTSSVCKIGFKKERNETKPERLEDTGPDSLCEAAKKTKRRRQFFACFRF